MLRSSRRQFCQQMALVVAAGAGGPFLPACRSRTVATKSKQAEPPGPPLQTFTPEAFATLSAVCDRLLPRDQDPGAIDLGVPSYIDKAVAGDLGHLRELLLRSLGRLDKESRKRFSGRAFHETLPGEQDSMLELWQKARDGSQRFFEVMLTLTMEGAFGDPKHGGNLEGSGFTMIGFRPELPLTKMPSMPSMQHAPAVH